MNVDKTEERTANQNELVERSRDRITQKHKDLQILHVNLENPQGWKESATPARTKVSSQEWKVQDMSQNWTFPQCLSEEEESHPESQPCSKL